MRKKKSLYEPRALTYEEHKKIDEFLRMFQDQGKEVFDLLRQSFGDNHDSVKYMAKAINHIAPIKYFCDEKASCDRHRPLIYGSEEDIQWRSLYREIDGWITTGWGK